jgi:putative endonuclease
LQARVWRHKHKVFNGFTKRYNIGRLVYYEWTDGARGAIEREKQIKSWRRAKKIALVKKMNPTWRDLGDDFD